jgi:hypothetical protein
LRNEVKEQREEIVELMNLLKHVVLHPEEANVGEIIKRIFPESKQFPPSVRNVKLRLGNGKGTNEMCGIPDGIIAHLTRDCGGNAQDRHQSGRLGELFAVVGLRGGSRVTGGLSARGLANVQIGDWSDDFTFIVGDHRYRCPSSVAQFLSPRVSKLHLIDATILELRLEAEGSRQIVRFGFGSRKRQQHCS